MFYLPVHVSEELNLYADVRLVCTFTKTKQKGRKVYQTKYTHSATAFRRYSAFCGDRDATRCRNTSKAVETDRQTTALQMHFTQRRSSFKRSLSGGLPCKTECWFGRFGGTCCLGLQGLNLFSPRRCSDREKHMCVLHRNTVMIVSHQKYKRSCTEPMGMYSETSEQTSYRL